MIWTFCLVIRLAIRLPSQCVRNIRSSDVIRVRNMKADGIWESQYPKLEFQDNLRYLPIKLGLQIGSTVATETMKTGSFYGKYTQRMLGVNLLGEKGTVRGGRQIEPERDTRDFG